MHITSTSRRTLGSVICMLFLFFAQPVAAQTNPHETLTFEIGNINQDPRGLSSLAVEFGGYDISLFSEVNSGVLYITLPAPIENGEYPLIIQAFYDNGDIDLLVEESLNILNPQQHQWGYSLSLDQSYRAHDHPDAGFSQTDQANTNGAATLLGQYDSQNWQVNSQFETLYNSERFNNPSQEEFSLPYYQLEARHKGETLQSFVRLGDHYIHQQSLIFSSYQRRGLTTGIQSNDGSYDARFFAYHSDPGSSVHGQLTYPYESEERSSGAIVSYSPLTNKEALTVSTSYLRGKGRNAGIGFQNVYEENVLYGGDNWNLALQSKLFDEALHLKGEYAWSDFDSDGLNIGNDAQRDKAWNTSLEWHAAHNSQRLLFEQWMLGLQVQEVGLNYWSIGNLYLPGDLATRKLYYVGSSGGLSLSSEYINEQNNVAERSKIADLDADYLNIDVYYTPSDIDPESAFWKTLGLPSFSGYAHYVKRQQDPGDALLVGYDINHFTSEYNISANFNKHDWNWSLMHSQTWQDDRSSQVEENGFILYSPPSDSINYLTGLTLGLNTIENLYLSFLVQWNVLKEDETKNLFSNLNFGVESQWIIIPDKWTFNLNYSLSENDNKYNDEFNSNSRFRDQTYNLQTNWRLLQAQGLSPGVNVYFKGSYLRQQDIKSNNEDETYQLFVGLSLYWNKEGI